MSNEKLAAALRALISCVDFAISDGSGLSDDNQEEYLGVRAAAREALAEHVAEHQEGLLIIGNPVDGFRFVGPFGCESDAVEWATQHAPDETWTTATMQEPQV